MVFSIFYFDKCCDMGCVRSGMVQTSPENTKNKVTVEPITLKTDKVVRDLAREDRKSAIARHHSEAYSKAKSLSDRVLADKETLSTGSTVRSSWSRSTAPSNHQESLANGYHSANGRSSLNNSTDKDRNNGIKSVHFDNHENRSDSGHFSDIPGLADEIIEEKQVTMMTERTVSTSPASPPPQVIVGVPDPSEAMGEEDTADAQEHAQLNGFSDQKDSNANSQSVLRITEGESEETCKLDDSTLTFDLKGEESIVVNNDEMSEEHEKTTQRPQLENGGGA